MATFAAIMATIAFILIGLIVLFVVFCAKPLLIVTFVTYVFGLIDRSIEKIFSKKK